MFFPWLNHCLLCPLPRQLLQKFIVVKKLFFFVTTPPKKLGFFFTESFKEWSQGTAYEFSGVLKSVSLSTPSLFLRSHLVQPGTVCCSERNNTTKLLTRLVWCEENQLTDRNKVFWRECLASYHPVIIFLIIITSVLSSSVDWALTSFHPSLTCLVRQHPD